MPLVDPVAYAYRVLHGKPLPESFPPHPRSADREPEGQAEPTPKRSSRKGVTYRRCPRRDRGPRASMTVT
jgi:hypothetical protein